MKLRTSTYAFVIVFIAMLGCGAQHDGTEAEMKRPGDLLPGEMPFSRVPLQATVVTLIRGHREDPIPGKLGSMNWTLLGGVENPVPDRPWSQVVTAPRNGATALLFETYAAPVWVIVNIFVALDPETGLPIDPARGESIRFGEVYLECHPYSENCLEAEGDSWKWDGMPEKMFEQEYVTVGAHWLMQSDSSGREDGLLTASYQYHFVNE